jgi:hypothetical protein
MIPVTERIRLLLVRRFGTPVPAFLLQLAITVPVPQTGYCSCKGALQEMRDEASKNHCTLSLITRLFKIASVLVRFDHLPAASVNANHSIM